MYLPTFCHISKKPRFTVSQPHIYGMTAQNETRRSLRQALSLQTEYPDVERLYKQRSLDKLIFKGLWSVATVFASDDRGLMVRSCAVRSAGMH